MGFVFCCRMCHSFVQCHRWWGTVFCIADSKAESPSKRQMLVSAEILVKGVRQLVQVYGIQNVICVEFHTLDIPKKEERTARMAFLEQL